MHVYVRSFTVYCVVYLLYMYIYLFLYINIYIYIHIRTYLYLIFLKHSVAPPFKKELFRCKRFRERCMEHSCTLKERDGQLSPSLVSFVRSGILG